MYCTIHIFHVGLKFFRLYFYFFNQYHLFIIESCLTNRKENKKRRKKFKIWPNGRRSKKENNNKGRNPLFLPSIKSTSNYTSTSSFLLHLHQSTYITIHYPTASPPPHQNQQQLHNVYPLHPHPPSTSRQHHPRPQLSINSDFGQPKERIDNRMLGTLHSHKYLHPTRHTGRCFTSPWARLKRLCRNPTS